MQILNIDRILYAPGCVHYGSRPLGVNTQGSDYDVALSIESHKDIFNVLVNNNIPINPSIDYFTSFPEGGYYSFFRYKAKDINLDILFLRNNEDLDVIRSSIQDLQSIPAYMLSDKKFRISVYNKALQHRVWKKTTDTHPRRAHDDQDDSISPFSGTLQEIMSAQRATYERRRAQNAQEVFMRAHRDARVESIVRNVEPDTLRRNSLWR